MATILDDVITERFSHYRVDFLKLKLGLFVEALNHCFCKLVLQLQRQILLNEALKTHLLILQDAMVLLNLAHLLS